MANRSTVLAAMTMFTKSTKNPPDLTKEKAMIDLWTSLLQDVPDDLLMVAAQQLCVELVFFPSLAELRNKAIELKVSTLGIPTWGEAWKECIDYGNKFSWEQNGFSHPLVEKAYKQIGGWNTLMIDDIPTVRAQFRQIYESLLQRSMDEIKLLPQSKEVSEKYRLGVNNLVAKLESKNG